MKLSLKHSDILDMTKYNKLRENECMVSYTAKIEVEVSSHTVSRIVRNMEAARYSYNIALYILDEKYDIHNNDVSKTYYADIYEDIERYAISGDLTELPLEYKDMIKLMKDKFVLLDAIITSIIFAQKKYVKDGIHSSKLSSLREFVIPIDNISCSDNDYITIKDLGDFKFKNGAVADLEKYDYIKISVNTLDSVIGSRKTYIQFGSAVILPTPNKHDHDNPDNLLLRYMDTSDYPYLKSYGDKYMAHIFY